MRRPMMFPTALCCIQMMVGSPAMARPIEGAPGVVRRSAAPPNYKLLPGDKLEITVDALPELEKIYQVRSDGRIQHPVAGEIVVSGKTIVEVQKLLQARFQDYLKKPSFRVGIYSIAELEAAAMGEVKNQGSFTFTANSSLLDLLAQAGGATNKADLETAVLVRGEKEIPVNLKTTTKTELAKIKIVNGDILMLNEGKRVSVTGEVRDPGTFAVSYKSETPIEDAIKFAGGAKETAALQRVYVIRPELQKPILVDLTERDPNTGKIKSDVEIRDGDIISIQPLRCVVVGAVGKQGPVILTGNDTLFDIVSTSGGNGRLDEVVVIRAIDVEKGTEKREVYNLEEAFKDAKAIPKVNIYDGDVVYVPPREEGGNPLGLLSILMMARSFFAF